jgi:hypothetical protein
MTWGVESNVIERFGSAGVPAGNVSFAKDTYTFRFNGSPSALFAEFRTWYGPTMNAFAAAEQSGRAADLHAELEALFNRENRSGSADRTEIPATFLRATAIAPA